MLTKKKYKTMKDMIVNGNSERSESEYRCSTCDRKFNDENHFMKHQSQCKGMAAKKVCKICDTSYSCDTSLRRHMRKKHEEKVRALICEMCNKQFERQSDLSKHVNKGCNGIIDNFTCEVCETKFCSKSNLDRHVRNRHQDTYTDSAISSKQAVIQCSKCSKKFMRQSRLIVHEKICEKMHQIQFCKKCRLQFSDRNSLKRHMKRMHNKESGIKTSSLNTNPEGMSRDLRRKHKIETGLKNRSVVKNPNAVPDLKPVDKTCKVKNEKETGEKETQVTDFISAEVGKEVGSQDCSPKSSSPQLNGRQLDIVDSQDYVDPELTETLSNVESANNESDKETETESLHFHCGICNRTFTSFISLCFHKNKQHSLKTCKIYEEVFESGPDWTNHRRVHKNIEKKFCHICGKIFETSSGYNKHMQKHDGVFYPCEICEKRFTAKHTLKDHMMVHKGLKPFICEICGARFSQRAHLVRHNKTHTGERNYICQICSKRFSDRSGLNLHERTHTGFRPYECSICNKKFTQLAALKAHRKTHYMKRDFQCDVCKRTFTQKHSLLRHSVMHSETGNNTKAAYVTKPTLYCNKCPKGFVSKRGLVRHMQKHNKGILPVLKSDDLKENADDELRNVSALISSVHGHYQSEGETNLEIKTPIQSEYAENNMYSADQSSSHGVNPASENQKSSLFGLRTQDFHGQNMNKTLTLPDKLAVGNMVSNHESQPGTVPFNTNYSDGNTWSENEQPRNSICDMNVSENVVSPTYGHGSQILYNEVYTSMEEATTVARVLSSEVATENRGHSQPTISTYSDILNVPDSIEAVQKRILELNLSEGENVIIEIKSIPETAEETVVQLQTYPNTVSDPAYGLNTLSNVVCNLEDGTNTGWQSFRFSQPNSTKGNNKDADSELDNHTRDILEPKMIVVGSTEDIQSSKIVTVMSEKKSESGYEAACISDSETIVGEFDVNSHTETIAGDDAIESEKIESNSYSPGHINCNQNNITSHKDDAFLLKAAETDRNLEAGECLTEIMKDAKPGKASYKICKICSVQFSCSESLTQHMKIAHNSEQVHDVLAANSASMTCDNSNNIFHCENCNERFKSHLKLKIHLNQKCMTKLDSDKNIKDNKTKDNESEVIVVKEEMEKDKDACDDNSSRPAYSHHRCSFCDKDFTFANSLKFHERRHRESATFICEVCGKGFYKPSHLKRHVKQHENQIQTCFCDKCGKMFQKESLLKSHIRLHMGLDPYPCTLCSKSFKYSSNLKRHMRGHVDGSKDFAVVHSHFCELCGKGFTAETSLQVHLNIHRGAKPHKCELCGASFVQIGHLRRHEQSHKGIKKVKCDHCDKMFYDWSSLRVHMRSHTGERPYKCQICGKGFTQVQNLRTHERTHQGVKRFVCNQCEQPFTTKMALLRHEKRHTREGLLDAESKKKRYMTVKKMREKNIPCPNCSKLFTTRKSMLSHSRQYCTAEHGLDSQIKLHKQAGSDIKRHNDEGITRKSQGKSDLTRKVNRKAESTRKLLEAVDSIAESVPHVQKIKEKKMYVTMTRDTVSKFDKRREPRHEITSEDGANFIEIQAQDEVPSDLNIVHVVEEVPYSEIAGEEICQNEYIPASDGHQDYSESTTFSALPPLVSHPHSADNVFVTSSLGSHAVSSLTMAPMSTPLFSPLGSVPLNLVTLGPVSTLQMEHLSQDQYFHQEPQWRMPCP